MTNVEEFSYRRATSAVPSVEPSSTTMISLRGQLWTIADSIAMPIHLSELYAGIRIETRGVISRIRPNEEDEPSRTKEKPGVNVGDGFAGHAFDAFAVFPPLATIEV